MFDFLDDYRVRMENIAPFACFYKKLGDARKYGEEYDIFSLTFSVMLFILDCMLRNVKSDSLTIAGFLQELIFENYERRITSDEAMDVCHYILFDILQNDGIAFSHGYINPVTSLKERVRVSLIAQDEVKAGRGKVNYKLTDQGMEMLFMTKEVHRELRIPVTQLYLKQQIEKGVFDKALYIVNDLSLMVRQLREKINDMVRKIRSNPVNINFSEYEDIHRRIFEQFEKDDEEYEKLILLLGEKRDVIEGGDRFNRTEEEGKALILIHEISDRLTSISNEHKKLFMDKFRLKRVYREALENQFAAGFACRLNFEKEVLDFIIGNNSFMDGARKVFSPVLNLKRNKYFNISKCTDEQVKRNEEEDFYSGIIEEDFDTEAEENRKEKLREKYRNFRRYLKLIASSFGVSREVSLSDFLDSLDKEERDEIISSSDFYTFFILFHQAGKIELREIERDRDYIVPEEHGEVDIEKLLIDLIDEGTYLKGIKSLLFYSNGEVITLDNDVVMSNFIVVVE